QDPHLVARRRYCIGDKIGGTKAPACTREPDQRREEISGGCEGHARPSVRIGCVVPPMWPQPRIEEEAAVEWAGRALQGGQRSAEVAPADEQAARPCPGADNLPVPIGVVSTVVEAACLDRALPSRGGLRALASVGIGLRHAGTADARYRHAGEGDYRAGGK